MERLLCIKLRRLGDTVLLTGALQALAQAQPKSQIDVVVPRSFRDLLTEEPYLHRVFGVSGHVADRIAVASLLRLRRYDRVLVFHASSSARFFGSLIGGGQVTVHSHEIGKTDSTVKPATERDRDTLTMAGIETGPVLIPSISLRPDEIASARAWAKDKNLRTPILGLGLGASRQTKMWEPSRMAEIVERWGTHTGGSAVVVCNRTEAAQSRGFWDRLRSGRTPWLPLIDVPVRALAARLSLASVFLGNDSGPRHLAAAVGVRSVTLFGPEDPYEWHPYSRSEHPICFVPDLKCRASAGPGLPPWCGLETCNVERHRCMEEISVDRVWGAVEGLLP